MDNRHHLGHRLGAALLVVAVGATAVPTAQAGGHGSRSGVYGEPHGPIFQTLDALAGGIETVLQRTVLADRHRSSCDARGCDDGCDAGTLRHMHTGMPRGSYGHRVMPHSHASTPQPHRMHHSGSVQHAHRAPQPQSHSDARPSQRPQSVLQHPSRQAEQPQRAPEERMPARPLPQVPAERDALTTEDNWIDSFEPSQPAPPVHRRPLPRRPERRSDGLSNPFDGSYESR